MPAFPVGAGPGKTASRSVRSCDSSATSGLAFAIVFGDAYVAASSRSRMCEDVEARADAAFEHLRHAGDNAMSPYDAADAEIGQEREADSATRREPRERATARRVR